MTYVVSNQTQYNGMSYNGTEGTTNKITYYCGHTKTVPSNEAYFQQNQTCVDCEALKRTMIMALQQFKMSGGELPFVQPLGGAPLAPYNTIPSSNSIQIPKRDQPKSIDWIDQQIGGVRELAKSS